MAAGERAMDNMDHLRGYGQVGCTESDACGDVWLGRSGCGTLWAAWDYWAGGK